MRSTSHEDDSRAYREAPPVTLIEAANVWWYVTDARPAMRHHLHGNGEDDICTELVALQAIARELTSAHESTTGLRVWPFLREQDTIQEVPHATR
jgi:hypothetical protein